MKVYLDDKRTEPEGWTRCYWPDEVIAHLERGDVTHCSLDHDLGDDLRGDGYAVILWIEEAVATRGYDSPLLRIHSDNGPGIDRMRRGIASIERYAGKKLTF